LPLYSDPISVHVNDAFKIGDTVFRAGEVLEVLKVGNTIVTLAEVAAKLYVATQHDDKEGAFNAIADWLVVAGATAVGTASIGPVIGLGIGGGAVLGLDKYGSVTGLAELAVVTVDNIGPTIMNTPDDADRTLNQCLNQYFYNQNIILPGWNIHLKLISTSLLSKTAQLD
jgi:hypothetical protein